MEDKSYKLRYLPLFEQDLISAVVRASYFLTTTLL